MDKDLNDTLQELLSLMRRIDEKLTVQTVFEKGVESDGNKNGVQKKTSAKEFIIEKKPEGAVQTTLATGYYLEQFEGISSFNKDDIERVYRLAKMVPPVNINDKVNMCIRSGYMMESEEKKDSKKAWVLTALGERYVENSFTKEK